MKTGKSLKFVIVLMTKIYEERLEMAGGSATKKLRLIVFRLAPKI